VRRLIFVLFAALPLLAADDDSFIIRGAVVHPVSGPQIENGSIIVRDGKIVGVGKNLSAPKACASSKRKACMCIRA